MSTRHQLEPETRRHAAAAPAATRRVLPYAVVALLIVAIAAVSVLLLLNHGGGNASAAKNHSAPRLSASAPAPTARQTLSPVSQNSAETVAPAGAGAGATSSATSTGTSASGASAPAAGTAKASKPAAAKYVKYTVKPGDNLWVIANWFHQKGYRPIYQWNQTTIGKDPSLIRPGQTLIVAVRS